MGRKRRKYDVEERRIQPKTKEQVVSKVIDTTVIQGGHHDEANPLILPDKGSSKKNKKKKKQPPPPKILSKKQQKKLRDVLRRKQKVVNRAEVLKEVSKHALPKEILEKLQSLPKHCGRRGLRVKKTKRSRDDDDDDDLDGLEEEEDGQDPLTSKRIKRMPEPDVVMESNNDPNIVAYRPQDEEDESDEEIEPDLEDKSSEVKDVTEDDNKTIPTEVITEEFLSKKVEKPSYEPTVHVDVNRSPEVEESRSKLPILGEEQAIVETIRYNDVVIICGETGSGKTTQVPQFLYEAGYASSSTTESKESRKRMICITEPRRVAAISMSTRVAHEMNLSSKVVSYHIRYDHNVSKDTKIKFVTDGVLLKEIQRNFTLDDYSVVIIDEAHERSVFSDILIGLLSRIVNLRRNHNNPLKLIIMSATLRVDDFAKNSRLFKTPPPLLKIESRQFPVTIHFSKTTPDNYINGALAKVSKIHRTLPDGGILVFVTGRNDVTTLVKKLRKMFPSTDCVASKGLSEKKERHAKSKVSQRETKIPKKAKPKMFGDMLPKISLDDFNDKDAFTEENRDSDEELDSSDDDEEGTRILPEEEMTHQPLYCLPLYSLLPKDKQELVFKSPPEGHRLCVVATNVAETSLTIPGIKYVVDTGKVKKKVYDKTTGISAFIVSWTSKASADQRSGRSGRTCPGHSFRLYSSAVFTNEFPDFSEPEIASKPIDDLVLQMKSLDILNVNNFPFPTPPSTESLIASEKRLVMMGALEEIKTSVSVSGRKATCLTSMGKVIAQFPVSPRFGRMLAFAYNDLLPYVIALVAGMTVQEIFLSSVPSHVSGDNNTDAKTLQLQWNALRRRWSGSGNSQLLGDLMLLLKAIGASEYTGGSFAFSVQNGLSHKAMTEVHKLRKQLTQEVNRVFSTSIPLMLTPPEDMDALHLRQVALAGFFDHVARKAVVTDTKLAKKKPYQSIQVDDYVFIDSQSILAQETPEWVVYQEIHETSKMFMRNVVAIEPSWLPVYSPKLCNLSGPLENPPPYFDSDRDAVMSFVEGTFGPHAWQLPVSCIEFPETADKYKWFARLFLEGSVLDFMKEFSSHFLSSPKILLKSWANLQPKLMSIYKTLQSKGVCSISALKHHWKQDAHFLMPEVKEWLSVSQHFQLQEAWDKKID